MAKRKKKECYHCKEKVAEGAKHDCWTTTPEKLTEALGEDLKEAWERLREFAASLGEQRVYASHRSIMFAHQHCHFFVRPKKKALEVVFFLARKVKDVRIRRSESSSKTKFCHSVLVTHRDEVEAPLTDWLTEAFELSRAAAKK